MIQRKNGAHKIAYFAKKASTAFPLGCAVSVDSSGWLIPATATSVNHVGICMVPVASTDSDYASTTKIPVDIANSSTDQFEAEVSAGTVAQTVVGDYFDFNSTGDKVDLSASTIHQVFVVAMNAAASTVTVQINSLASTDESGS